MERNDFISGDAYYRYKFERESKNEEIQRLRTKMERMRTDNYVRVAYDSVVITVLVAFIAFLSGNIDEVRLDDIVFYPADKERFLTLEKMVKKYKDQFAAMKADAKAHGISIEELCKQFANRRTIEVWIDGIQ